MFETQMTIYQVGYPPGIEYDKILNYLRFASQVWYAGWRYSIHTLFTETKKCLHRALWGRVQFGLFIKHTVETTLLFFTQLSNVCKE